MSNRIQSLIAALVVLPLVAAAPLLAYPPTPAPSPLVRSMVPSPAPSASPSPAAAAAVGNGHDISIYYTCNIIGEVDPCG